MEIREKLRRGDDGRRELTSDVTPGAAASRAMATKAISWNFIFNIFIVAMLGSPVTVYESRD